MTRYQSGANFERIVKKRYENLGYFVIRSAGSHSPVDLIVLCGGNNNMLIQCKRDGKLSKKERFELKELSRKTGILVFLVKQAKTIKDFEVIPL